MVVAVISVTLVGLFIVAVMSILWIKVEMSWTFLYISWSSRLKAQRQIWDILQGVSSLGV